MSITATQDVAWDIQSATPLSTTQDIAWDIQSFAATLSAFQDVSWPVGTTGDLIQVVLDGAPTGLVGQLLVSVVTEDGSVTILFPTSQGIVESPVGTGRYVATITRPDVGSYFVVWTDGITSVFTSLEVTLFGINTANLRVLKAPTRPLDDGDLMEFVVTISDHADSAVDPEILTLHISPPAGADVTYTYGDIDEIIVRDSVGRYRAAVPTFGESSVVPSNLTKFVGSWRWEASGDYQDAEEGRFIVRRSLVAT